MGGWAGVAGAACVGGAGGNPTSGAGVCGVGTVLQAASIPTIRTSKTLRPVRSGLERTAVMTLLLLEALGALLLLIFIVWWTMFSGRKKGELPESVEREKAAAPKAEDSKGD
jgi:hypothetical protein